MATAPRGTKDSFAAPRFLGSLVRRVLARQRMTELAVLDVVDGPPTKILIVDDTPANLIAVEAALAPLGRQIVTAGSGTQALELLLQETFVVALVDIQMPGLDGYELARLIRNRERTSHLPIIFTTAYAHDESAVLRGYELGAIDFMFRPLIPQVLRAKVQVFITLEERNAQLAAERSERQRREFEAAALRRERDQELATNQELNRLNDLLAEHDRRKDRFMAILAHELRNPLASLRLGVDLLRSRIDEPPTPRAVSILEHQASVLTQLVDDLLDLSRIKADKIELRPEPLSLQSLVEAAVTMSRSLFEERHHALEIVVPPDPITVVADSLRISQVIANLLSNAARYTRPGGHIEVTVATEDELGIVRVRDDGIGIPPDLKEKVFELFAQERTDPEVSGGLGLGLAFARRLVELHNGTIAAASEGRDRGSTFEVRLPRVTSPLSIAVRRRTRDLQPIPRSSL
jgi:two-component system, sensor histidine kinase